MRTLAEKIADLPFAGRKRVRERTNVLLTEEMSLRALRKAKGRTQVEIARRLHMGQDGVSRIEGRADLMLSTLRKYVEAMDGELDLVARFRDGQSVRIASFGAIEPLTEPDDQALPRQASKRAARGPSHASARSVR